jgi:transcriptional regulator with XRE-family HTH domain
MTGVAARFGENLTRLRERSGVTQEDLAFRASLHRTEIGLLERGGRIPRIDTLAKLAGALVVLPGELLDGIVWEPGSVRRGDFKSLPTTEATSKSRAKAPDAHLNAE